MTSWPRPAPPATTCAAPRLTVSASRSTRPPGAPTGAPALWQAFGSADGRAAGALPAVDDFSDGLAPRLPAPLLRSTPFLTHPVFNRHGSETEMLRYIRSLSDRDLALDRTMIPLGSCTMKLNATSEMIPITWPGFADIHPYAPADQREGYALLDAQLREWLCQATGYAGISLQPNAGSQGELRRAARDPRATTASRGQGTARPSASSPRSGARDQRRPPRCWPGCSVVVVKTAMPTAQRRPGRPARASSHGARRTTSPRS